jgi:hypothetical protein
MTLGLREFVLIIPIMDLVKNHALDLLADLAQIPFLSTIGNDVSIVRTFYVHFAIDLLAEDLRKISNKSLANRVSRPIGGAAIKDIHFDFFKSMENCGFFKTSQI